MGGRRWRRIVLSALGAWLAVSVGLWFAGSAEPGSVGTALRFVAADVFLVGAVLRLFRWHATRDPAQGWHAAGLGLASLLFPLTATLGDWTVDGVHQTGPGLAVRVAALLAIAPMLAALRGCPGRLVALALLATASALRLAEAHLAGWATASAPGFGLAAAALLTGAAVAELRTSWPAPDREDELELELATAQARLDRVRQVQRERLHDARSAMVGVLGASAALADQQAAVGDRAALQRAITDELARLACVLGVEPSEPVGRFDLPSALLPILRLHRLDTPGLSWTLDPVTATGRPRATATALDNLLRNARVHAPGAAVRVWTRTQGGRVEIVVDDDGPGIPPADRERLLEPGARGGDGSRPGWGLGLSNVAAAMREQDGHVELAESDSGGTRAVLSLPAAAPVAAALPVAC